MRIDIGPVVIKLGQEKDKNKVVDPDDQGNDAHLLLFMLSHVWGWLNTYHHVIQQVGNQDIRLGHAEVVNPVVPFRKINAFSRIPCVECKCYIKVIDSTHKGRDNQ